MRLLGLAFISVFSMLAFTVPAPAAPGSAGPSFELVSCGNGVLEQGEDCDDGNTVPGDCCSPTCQFESASTECRAAAGACDVPDNCDGAGSCTPDAKLTTECRAAAGICDIAEFCDGVTDDCPVDALEPPTTECRGAAGICDAVDYCDGASAGCPPDEKLTITTECRPASQICDAAEFCDGVSDSCPIIIDLPANGLPCPDGDLCNGDEICVGWICMPGEPLVCDDEDICTADSCDPELGCVYEPSQCIDGRPLPSASPPGRLLLSLLLVAAGATFLARCGRFGA